MIKLIEKITILDSLVSKNNFESFKDYKLLKDNIFFIKYIDFINGFLNHD